MGGGNIYSSVMSSNNQEIPPPSGDFDAPPEIEKKIKEDAPLNDGDRAKEFIEDESFSSIRIKVKESAPLNDPKRVKEYKVAGEITKDPGDKIIEKAPMNDEDLVKEFVM